MIIKRGPTVPPELQLNVIDHLLSPMGYYGFRAPDEQATLLKCMFVCHSWSAYIQRFMHIDVCIEAGEDWNRMSVWRTFLKCNPSKARSIRSMLLDGSNQSYSALLLTQKFQCLDALCIRNWDLEKETTWIQRATSCLTSVSYLHLSSLGKCTVAQLTRVINSFPSLSVLFILFLATFQKLDIRNKPLPMPCKKPTFSLKYLESDLVTGIPTLLHWFIRADSFVANLKALTFILWNADELETKCEGIARFLDHCATTLEELTLRIGKISGTDDVADLSK